MTVKVEDARLMVGGSDVAMRDWARGMRRRRERIEERGKREKFDIYVNEGLEDG